MKRKLWFVLSIFSLLAILLSASLVSAAPPPPEDIINLGANTDNPSHPLGEKQALLREKGFEAKVAGKVSGPVAEVAKGQFVELSRQGEDLIFTVLADFGPADHPAPILLLGRSRPAPQRNSRTRPQCG